MASQTPTSIMTITGQYLDVINPDPRDIKAWDISWGMSRQNRFCGHTITPWTVLDHIGLCYHLAWTESKGAISEHNKIALLLHDSSEALICDMPRPLKSAMPDYVEAEKKLMQAILVRFNVDPSKVDWSFVKRYDNQALWVEVQILRQFGRNDVIYAAHPIYEMAKLPELVKARQSDYISILRELAINMNASDLRELFECPDYLASVIGSAQFMQQGAVAKKLPIDISESDASLTMAQVKVQARLVGEEENPIAPVAKAPNNSDLYGVS